MINGPTEENTNVFAENFIKWRRLFDRYQLTGRQAQVCRLAALGLTDSQIGDHIGISSGTVKAHLSYVFAKLGVNTRHHILLLMLEQSYQLLKGRVGQGI